MKYSLQFSDALHILAYIEIFQGQEELTSQTIADSVNTNSTRIRRIMGKLKAAGILCSKAGVAKPTLTRPAESITFLDVYQALDEPQYLIPIDQNTNGNCPVGASIKGALAKEYDKLQAVLNQEMGTMTLADLLADMQVDQ